MKRLWISFCLGVLTLSILSCGAPGQGLTEDTTVSGSDFNLVFEYGAGGAPTKNVLDTFQGTFTKDMIVDPPVTVKLKLSDQDLSRIRDKMDKIDFWDYPDVLEYEPRADGLTVMVTPYTSYYFKATMGKVVKEVTWENEYLDESPRAVALKELAQLIQQIIESTPEYEALPEPRGGYM